MEFKPIKNSRVYQHVIDQIKNLIYEGKLKRGINSHQKEN